MIALKNITKRRHMIKMNSVYMLLVSSLCINAMHASKPIIQKTATQIILEKPYRHEAAIAVSATTLSWGLRGLSKAPGILKTPFSVALICGALASLYKTEQVTGKSTIQTIAEPLYAATLKKETKCNDLFELGYNVGIKQIDKATTVAEVIIKEYSEKKD